MQTVFREETAVVQQINEILREKIGDQKYRIWFRDSVKFSFTEDRLTVFVPSTFTADWIGRHFREPIESALEQSAGKECKLEFRIDESIASKANDKAEKTSQPGRKERKPAEKKSGKRKSGKQLKMKLDSFVVGRSNELAYNAARAVASQKDSPFNPLFIHGGYGVGKTHLMQGICNYVSCSRPESRWTYLSAEDFANQFILALKTRKLDRFRNKIRKTDLLAIDDIHFLANKPSTQQEFLHTFNSIDLAGKQIVLVSDAHPKMINQLSEKLIDRFVSGMVVKINAPDFETRCGICRQYAKSLKKDVPERVIRLIAENIQTNARELEGAMLKLSALTSLYNSKITLDIARQVLAGHLSRKDPTVHISDIESAVAEYFDTTVAKLHSSKKDKTVSLARHCSMYLARKHTNMSFPELGRSMGKNHATVIQGCRRIENHLKDNVRLNWRGLSGNRCVKSQTVIEELEKTIAK